MANRENEFDFGSRSGEVHANIAVGQRLTHNACPQLAKASLEKSANFEDGLFEHACFHLRVILVFLRGKTGLFKGTFS